MLNAPFMNRCTPLILGSVVIFLFAFAIIDYRLYVTYIDYRNARHLHCLRCGALGCKHETLGLFGNCKLQQQNSWTLMHKIPLRDLYSIETIYAPNICCDHEWAESLTQVKKDVHSDHFFYAIPQELYDDYDTADRVLMCVLLSVLILVLGVLFRKFKPVIRFMIVCDVILASVSIVILTYCARVHLGTRATDLLMELRKTRKEVMRRETAKENLDKAVYLLSKKPIIDCVQRYVFVESNEIGCVESTIPIRMLLKEQARLASAIAPHEVALAERYFYGRSLQTTESFEELLRSMNNNCRLYKGKYEKNDFIVYGVTTNVFGLVTIAWDYKGHSSLNIYGETIFQRIIIDVENENVNHWVPIRNIDGTSSTYSERMYLQNSW